MFMFLTILFASLIAVAFCTAILSTPQPNRSPEIDERIVEQSSRFFGGDIAPVPDQSPMPVELLLSQIERHVRLEQAAAERFVNLPTRESLASPTASPFAN